MNKDKNLEWDDVYQNAWLGFMKGANKYEHDRGTTLGAYCRSWCWGATYRSILGSRATSNARLRIGYPVASLPTAINFEDHIDLSDFIGNLPEPNRTVITMSAQGYKPREIGKQLQITNREITLIQEAFEISLRGC